MGTYQGRAVLITDEGDELAVGAQLQRWEDRLESWGGRLTVPGEHWETLRDKDQGLRLRLDNGQEGLFQRPHRQDKPAYRGAPFFFTVMGYGDAPF